MYLVDERLNSVPESEIEKAEKRLGISLPQGYKNFVTTYGVGTFCGFLVIPSPTEISKFSMNFRWNSGTDVLNEEMAKGAYQIASTIDADVIIFCPKSEKGIYVLPRHSDSIFWIDENFRDPSVWFSKNGIERNSEPLKYFEPLVERDFIELRANNSFSLIDETISCIEKEFNIKYKVIHRRYDDVDLIFVKEMAAMIEVSRSGDYIRFDFHPSKEFVFFKLISTLEVKGLVPRARACYLRIPS